MQHKTYAFKPTSLKPYVNHEISAILRHSEHPIDGAFKIYKDSSSAAADKKIACEAVISHIEAQTKCSPHSIMKNFTDKIIKSLNDAPNADAAKKNISKIIQFINKVEQDTQSANALSKSLKQHLNEVVAILQNPQPSNANLVQTLELIYKTYEDMVNTSTNELNNNKYSVNFKLNAHDKTTILSALDTTSEAPQALHTKVEKMIKRQVHEIKSHFLIVNHPYNTTIKPDISSLYNTIKQDRSTLSKSDDYLAQLEAILSKFCENVLHSPQSTMSLDETLAILPGAVSLAQSPDQSRALINFTDSIHRAILKRCLNSYDEQANER